MMAPEHQLEACRQKQNMALGFTYGIKFCSNLSTSLQSHSGPLVQGWLLVVPKDCHLCIGAPPVQLIAELIGFLDDVVSSVRTEYGPVAVFEHGPIRPLTAVGCGVDYAHVHVVPETRLVTSASCEEYSSPNPLGDGVLFCMIRANTLSNRGILFLHESFAVKSVVGTGP